MLWKSPVKALRRKKRQMFKIGGTKRFKQWWTEHSYCTRSPLLTYTINECLSARSGSARSVPIYCHLYATVLLMSTGDSIKAYFMVSESVYRDHSRNDAYAEWCSQVCEELDYCRFRCLNYFRFAQAMTAESLALNDYSLLYDSTIFSSLRTRL